MAVRKLLSRARGLLKKKAKPTLRSRVKAGYGYAKKKAAAGYGYAKKKARAGYGHVKKHKVAYGAGAAGVGGGYVVGRRRRRRR